MVFPTLAFQLAYRYPPFRGQLLQVLRANPGVGQESLCSQMEKLIINPLETTSIQTLIVIVMTFWYVFWNGLSFFELFKLYLFLGLITTPHVSMVI